MGTAQRSYCFLPLNATVIGTSIGEKRRRLKCFITPCKREFRYTICTVLAELRCVLQISCLTIKNFRGIKNATIHPPQHAVLLGDNNTGKTTILEAIDLVLGPDRLNRTPPIDEHDFYQGKYRAAPPLPPAPTIPPPPPAANAGLPAAPPKIEIEVTISHLTPEQKAKFVDYVEFWDSGNCTLYQIAQPADVDAPTITEALRVTFVGCYDAEEDDFEGKTYFTRSLSENPTPVPLSKKHKQICGFLYLRSLRTGSRALSLERGSLLDIVLRLKEVRPQMWEDTLATLASYSVASDPQLGLSGVLESINDSLKRYVPKEWGIKPHLKVSNLTREHLRKVITAFATLDERRLAIVDRQHGIGKPKDSDSLTKLVSAFVRKAEESALGRLVIELVILQSTQSQTESAKVLREAATIYKVDIEAITAQVRQEFTAKEKTKDGKKAAPKQATKASKPVKKAAA
jgi:hypothetical protein